VRAQAIRPRTALRGGGAQVRGECRGCSLPVRHGACGGGGVHAKDRLGRWGEDLAAQWLTDAGWELLDRNWRGHRGELDIVAMDGDELVVVEVKTRSGPAFGHPAEAVDRRKLGTIRRLTGQWLAEHRPR